MVDWPAASDEPSIEGDPAIVGVSAPHRVLAFGSWLDAGKARAMEQAVEALRARGEAFRMAFTTLAGRPIEAQGRAIAGRAVLRLKDASGVKRELVELGSRHEALLSEVASLRTLIERLPSPVWTRDAAGRLTFVNAAYARAVEARDAADAVARGLELLDSVGAREPWRARAPRAAPMPAGCRPWSPARGAASTCSTFAPIPAAPASASTPPKRKQCAARSRAWSMRIAARSTQLSTGVAMFDADAQADLLQRRLSRAVGPRRRLSRSAADRLGGARGVARGAQAAGGAGLPAMEARSCTTPIALSRPRSTPGICPTGAPCASSPRPIRTAASPICSTT